MLALMLAALVFAAMTCATRALTFRPDTVDSLDVPAYMGLWYQMYANAASMDTFEKDAFCSTALYGINGDGTLSVHNDARIGSQNGTDYPISGYAYYDNDQKEPGQLMVHLDGVSRDSTYWITALGPITNGFYDWAIVSDSTGVFLYVLARDYETFSSEYETEVMAIVKDQGFTGLKKPIAEYQGDDCLYESVARKKQISSLKSSKGPDTVDSLDVPAYMGLWYQMYANAASMDTFEKDAFCSTALYGINGDGTLSVHNDARIGSTTGTDYPISGYAYYDNDQKEPGQLMVHLDGVSRDSTYWITALGPITNGFYDWAIVSDSTGVFLYVLARDYETFSSEYETEVMAIVKDQGFTGLKKPIAEYQGDDCLYESVARKKNMK